jgi:predicted component of type VI protein secretion system
MEKHKRIYWERGLDVTPEIFIATDNYHISQQGVIAQLHAFRSYGVLPGATFKITSRINNDKVFIDELYCTAVTRNGYLIDIQNDVVFEEISLRELTNEEHYVVLQVNPFIPKAIEKEKPFSQATYRVEIKKVQQKIENGIPVLKIYYNRGSQCWEIENNYVLPHVNLSTNETFRQKYGEIREELNAIIKKLPSDEPAYFQAKLIEVELQNYSLQEYPAELTLLLKKTVTIFKLYLEKINNTDEILMAPVESFIQIPYNHNDALPLLQMGIDCLKNINQRMDEKPQPVVIVTPVEEPEEEILANI